MGEQYQLSEKQLSEGQLHASKHVGAVNVKDLVPWCGVCCFIASCYTECPDCFGSVCENTIMCCKQRIIVCKCGKDLNEQLCKCVGLDCDVVKCKVCCKSRAQSCCLDVRASIPPNEEIPCLVTVCCVTCCYDYRFMCRCCKGIREIITNPNTTVPTGGSEWQEVYDRESGD